ncbi:MAG TPA: hypothetical protein PKW95_21540 [bacterium]|nr:hypothetical protein [bacterium]
MSAPRIVSCLKEFPTINCSDNIDYSLSSEHLLELKKGFGMRQWKVAVLALVFIFSLTILAVGTAKSSTSDSAQIVLTKKQCEKLKNGPADKFIKLKVTDKQRKYITKKFDQKVKHIYIKPKHLTEGNRVRLKAKSDRIVSAPGKKQAEEQTPEQQSDNSAATDDGFLLVGEGMSYGNVLTAKNNSRIALFSFANKGHAVTGIETGQDRFRILAKVEISEHYQTCDDLSHFVYNYKPRRSGDSFKLYSASLASGSKALLAENVVEYTFTNDCSRVIYKTREETRERVFVQLASITPHGTDKVVLTESLVEQTDIRQWIDTNIYYKVSPNSQYVVYRYKEQDVHKKTQPLYAISTSGGSPIKLPVPDSQFFITPEPTHVFYNVCSSFNHEDLYLIPITGGKPKKILDDWPRNISKKTILYYPGTTQSLWDNDKHLYLIDYQTGKAELLYKEASSQELTLGPGGEWFIRYGMNPPQGEFGYYLFDTRTKTQTLIIDDLFHPHALSPDLKKFVYIGKDNQLHVRSLSGDEHIILSKPGSIVTEFIISPDSKYILYLDKHNRDARRIDSSLYLVSIDGEQAEMIERYVDSFDFITVDNRPWLLINRIASKRGGRQLVAKPL